MRGVAALSIVIFHYHHFYLADAFDRPGVPETGTFPYASVLGVFYTPFGARAVELFWVISGFVFAHVYLPRPVSLWQFGVARFARLYPLHGLLLLIVAALQWVSLNAAGHWQIYANNDWRHFGLHAVMASNWSTLSRGLSFNGPFWSVSLEILVYGMFFVSLSLLRRFPIPVSLGLSGLCWTVALQPNISLPLVQQAVFTCGAYFFLGSTLYGLCFRGAPKLRMSLALAAIGGLFGGLGLWLGEEELATAGICSALVLAAACLDLRAGAAGRMWRALGDMSYSLYLVHVPLQMCILLVADTLFAGDRSFADNPLVLPLYVIASIALAHLSYRFYERPARGRLRRLLTGAPSRPTMGARTDG